MLIQETARRLTGYRWTEERLFELTGAWAADAGAPGLARVLAVQSRHHGWRATMWAELVPVLHDVGPAEPTVAEVAQLEALADGPSPVARFAELTRVVLPHLLDRYRDHLAGIEPIADAPVARLLRLVVVDVEHDRQTAEALLSEVGE